MMKCSSANKPILESFMNFVLNFHYKPFSCHNIHLLHISFFFNTYPPYFSPFCRQGIFLKVLT